MVGSLQRTLFSGFTFWIALALLGFYWILPLRENLRFGMDLVGGTYITLEVQTEKAVEEYLFDKQDSLNAKLRDRNAALPVASDVKDGALTLSFDNSSAAHAADSSLKGFDKDLVLKVEGSNLVVRLQKVVENRIKRDAVERNIDVLRTRVDKIGVAEISIAAQGERNIIVELPDVSDPQQAKAMIGKAAVLDFRIVQKSGNSKEDILYDYDGVLPMGSEILPGEHSERGGSKFYLVERRASVSGKDLQDARPQFDQNKGQMTVGFTLTSEGGQRFYQLTTKAIGKQLAVVLDGVVITAPVVNEPIRNQGSITGHFSTEEAKELALLLKSGSFVAPVTFEEERQIGPSLGAESIHSGYLACVIALGLIFLFSIWYYSLSGILAFIALLYNLLLIMLGLAWLGATLTLPGIAGMVLTVGMAIDASILIFERIKEELASGVSVRAAVNDGFSDAMRVILDANFTTLIVGFVLYKFGTGPIQGFAVTMMLGIISTLITGLFFLKSLFTVVLNVFDVKTLKI